MLIEELLSASGMQSAAAQAAAAAAEFADEEGDDDGWEDVPNTLLPSLFLRRIPKLKNIVI